MTRYSGTVSTLLFFCSVPYAGRFSNFSTQVREGGGRGGPVMPRAVPRRQGVRGGVRHVQVGIRRPAQVEAGVAKEGQGAILDRHFFVSWKWERERGCAAPVLIVNRTGVVLGRTGPLSSVYAVQVAAFTWSTYGRERRQSTNRPALGFAEGVSTGEPRKCFFGVWAHFHPA